MKVLVNSILILVIGVLGYTLIKDEFFPCSVPLSYTIGDVDAEFGLSREGLLSRVREAEELWENAAGRDLFEYTDSSGKVEVSLVYDERQQETLAARQLEGTLDEQDGEIAQATIRYESLTHEYQSQQNAFNSRVEEYDRRRSAYEQRTRAWNRSDRSDEEEFEWLQQEEDTLDALYTSLEEDEAELMELYSELEEARQTRNSIAAEYNESVKTYNNRFADGGVFDQGEYDGKDTAITIYQFENETDLTLVLAHELGHALGVDHVEDPRAVMHYMMNEQAANPIKLTEADVSGLETACRL